MQQLSVDSRGVAILQRYPRNGYLQITASTDVYVHGVCFFVLAEEYVDGRFVLHGQTNVERLHLSCIARHRSFRHFHREVILRVEEFE